MATSVFAALIPFLLYLCPPVWAQETCSLLQVTDTPVGLPFPDQNFWPTISLDGSRIGFTSDADLVTGGNLDFNFEIYLYEVATNTFTQVTDTTASQSRPTISGDGTRIAFDSNSDLAGGNPDTNTEIFIFDVPSSTFIQVSNTIGPSCAYSSISDDGSRVAYYSSNDVVTGGNVDGNREVYLWDEASGLTTQVTFTVGGNVDPPAISGDGSRIAIYATSDVIAGGNTDGNSEIYLYDVASISLTQVTATLGGGSYYPRPNHDGSLLALQSNRDLVPGGNTDGTMEIFLFDVATTSFTQITTSPAGDNQRAVFSGDGSRLAFSSSSNIDGGNPDGSTEVVLFDRSTGQFDYLTSYTNIGPIFDPTPHIDLDGSHCTFSFLGDLTGGNPDLGIEVFLSTCLRQQARIPALMPAGAALLALLILIAGLLVMARSRIQAGS